MNFLDSPGVSSMEVKKFYGPKLLGDKVDGPYCLAAQNVEYVDNQVQTRRGFGAAWNPAAIIYSMYNWVQSTYNRLLYLTSAGAVISRDLVTPANTVTLVTGLTSAIGMNCVAAGYRVYMAFFKDRSTNPGNPQSAYVVKIWDGTIDTGTPNVETAFSPAMLPAAVTLAGSEPGAGFVTAGVHYFGFLITTYNGGTPPPSPLDAPKAITAAGNKLLTITITPATTWPTYVRSVQLIATTVDNPNRFYIVGDASASATVLRGTGVAATVSFNTDDVSLQLYEEILPGTANDYFSVFQSNGSSLEGPYGAMKILAYGSRMVYIYEGLGPDSTTVQTYIAISQPGLPQFVTLAQHVLNLPEFRQCITGFVLGDVLYLLGPGWTYAFSDNGLAPVQWSQPRLVSGAIGTPFINGVLSNPSRGYAWVADRSGLYFFTGSSFPIKPVSYLQSPDWQRIHWHGSADSMEILDDTENRLVMVKAALDSSSTANYWMVWDYTLGPDPDSVKYCGLWSIADFSPGALAVVLNPDVNSNEVWVSRRTSGNVLRQKDWSETDLYEDDGAGIDDLYAYGYFPGMPTDVMDHLGGDFRLFGNGTASLTSYSLDGDNPVEMPSVPLEATPGRRFFRGVNKQSEGASVAITSGATAGSYFVLSALRWYWRKFGWRT